MVHSICEILGILCAAALVVVTAVLARYTYGLVVATQSLFKETKESAARQLGVNTWLHFVSQWDSPGMRLTRKNSATQIKHYKIMGTMDPIMDFFEQVGTVYRLNCIDKELVYSSFSYDAANWWVVLKDYVYDLRKQMGDDQTVYCEMEAMVADIRATHPGETEPTSRDAHDVYLKDEMEL